MFHENVRIYDRAEVIRMYLRLSGKSSLGRTVAPLLQEIHTNVKEISRVLAQSEDESFEALWHDEKVQSMPLMQDIISTMEAAKLKKASSARDGEHNVVEVAVVL